jgi:hypothetical protein
MGCVWQSDCAPEPEFGDETVPYRATARHRKPPVWRRAARGVVPLLASAAARYRPGAAPHRVDPAGGVVPLTRGR